VAAIARIRTEFGELKRVENSPSLWSLHADSLVTLLEIADAIAENGRQVIAEAEQQKNAAPAEAIKVSLGKLQDCGQLVKNSLSPEKSRAQTV
jgi:hypothetical protein